MGKSVIKKEDINWSQAQQIKSNAYKIIILIPNIPERKNILSHFIMKQIRLYKKLILVVKV